MFILLYIVLGILFFDCLAVCCLYFRNGITFEQDEEYSNYLEIVNSTE
jgi:hypothetical protein